MKNRMLALLLLSVFLCLLTACNKPFMQTMGSNPIKFCEEIEKNPTMGILQLQRLMAETYKLAC